jgi:hypothetical protein
MSLNGIAGTNLILCLWKETLSYLLCILLWRWWPTFLFSKPKSLYTVHMVAAYCVLESRDYKSLLSCILQNRRWQSGLYSKLQRDVSHLWSISHSYLWWSVLPLYITNYRYHVKRCTTHKLCPTLSSLWTISKSAYQCLFSVQSSLLISFWTVNFACTVDNPCSYVLPSNSVANSYLSCAASFTL